MATLGFPIRRLRRQINHHTAPIIISAFIFFSLITLFNIDYAPVGRSVRVEIDLPEIRTVTAKSRVDWKKNAYVQYVDSPEELCKAVMVFSELHESFSYGLRVLYYPSAWHLQSADDKNADPQARAIARLLREASQEFTIVLQPTDNFQEHDNGHIIFENSLRKFLAFNLTQYDKVIVLDTDSIVTKSMDELFLLPATPMALPYVYLPEEKMWALSTALVMMSPSTLTFQQVRQALSKSWTDKKHDESVVLDMFESTLFRLPQRPYHLLSEQFRTRDQSAQNTWLYEREKWDAADVMKAAKFVALWDPPMPGPWALKQEDLQTYLPPCALPIPVRPGIRRKPPARDCSNRNTWAKLYNDFSNRRRIVCGEGFDK